ncbi:Peptidoglycan/xylan/chitin deacetylase, PgdA/CDA1 family [Sanguibacter gelidistatuariae]|uniref:Peptidoglycan/xylan/chitin deacetylase, PgdA/CDA1 family n=1 Tax=Sanguibacter gelidistatuariae TaxID=1814289 RepID=A0A1G6NQP8_9MICO|nr:polysaccharide deacetylase family protein [Sanguibacter gelidistatuariae]SDC70038.1 Peptidoglycan/xylan/chitin deacetylase, PgdA/CDA1 family [Sanguibacter gelidistatuariae]
MAHQISRRHLLSVSALTAVTAAAVVGAAGQQPVVRAPRKSPSDRVPPRRESATGTSGTDVFWRMQTVDQLVALTFDDGPDPRWTPMVLSALADHGAQATFFQMGKAVRKHPEVTRAVHDAGHEVASHTAEHKDLTDLDYDQIWDNLTLTHEAIVDAIGTPPTLLRPPYGRIDSLGLFAAAELGYRVAMWSHHLPTWEAEAAVDHNIATASPGMIILCHDGRGTPEDSLYVAVRRLLGELTKDGYTFVTVSDMLAAQQARAS